jgi:solute carrier family 39 (zinc transporter), member 1/2/3
MIWGAVALFAVSPMATVLAQPTAEVTVDILSSSNSSLEDPCAEPPLETYNLGSHVGGVFTVLAVSSFGMFGSLCLGSATSSPTIEKAMTIFKMFGTGVIAGTAWIHLPPEAFAQFSNPCLQGYWTEYGASYVGLFSMIAAFMVQLVEMAIGAHEDHEHPPLPPSTGHETGEGTTVGSVTLFDIPQTEPPVVDRVDKVRVMSQRLQTMVLEGGILTHSVIIGITLGVTSDDQFTTLLIAICFHQVPRSAVLRSQSRSDVSRHKFFSVIRARIRARILCRLRTPQRQSTNSCISMRPSTHHPAGQPNPAPQEFEGIALGSLLSGTDLRRRSQALLGALYPLTAPLGIALGIGLRTSYSENSQATILTQGVLGSLCSGILVYNTYAELIGAQINRGPALRGCSATFRAAGFLAMYVGAGAMAALGLWA